MKSPPHFLLVSSVLLLFLLSFVPARTSSANLFSLTPDRPLKDGDVLISIPRATFALGFFSPTNSTTSRYLGIWFNKIPQQTLVWVANRDTPLNNTSGVLSVNNAGNLVLLIARSNNTPNYIDPIVWSANVSARTTNNGTSAQLLDSGNLVLIQRDTKEVLWESFDHPTDTMLPNMRLGLNRKTGLNRFLTSWKSPYDPGTGTYHYRIDPAGYPQLFLYKNMDPIWRTGSWIGKRWSGVPEMEGSFIFNSTFVNNASEVSVMYQVTDDAVLTRMVVNETEQIMEWYTWQAQGQRWFRFWYAPKEDCDRYNRCGPNGKCEPYITPNFECTCLPGFEPKSARAWYLRDPSGGCVRKHGVSTCGRGEGFVKVARAKVPNTLVSRANLGMNMKVCKENCLKDCSCVGYATANESIGSGCLTWHGDLMDTRIFTNVGQDLYIRVDAHELAKYEKKYGSLGPKGMLAVLVLSVSLMSFLMVILLYWFRKKKREGSQRESHAKYSFSFNSAATLFEEYSQSLDQLDGSGRNSDIPLFGLSTLVAATDCFSDNKKLGQGGFGPVYKGVLSNGMEIAVKRLSKHSGQGIKEFKNEVSLVAKLQHRNLVRILGCCIEQEERMIIYEYLPNKSLDSFIFDESKKSILDWRKRLDIINGVARGILYLHEDSRLRIVHRDLKASNVLLDSVLHPKIADFGMAKIFGGDQIEAETNRVVGTYGYMSPEYAMEGHFSIKSDVYSFGVLVLEIITGRRNSGFYQYSPTTNLIGHVWELWNEGKSMEIVETSISDESCASDEVLRCIQIGLLCVQDYSNDRPTMSAVVSMLTGDSSLACPKQPAFLFKRACYTSADPSTSTGGMNSVSEMTDTIIEAR